MANDAGRLNFEVDRQIWTADYTEEALEQSRRDYLQMQGNPLDRLAELWQLDMATASFAEVEERAEEVVFGLIR